MCFLAKLNVYLMLQSFSGGNYGWTNGKRARILLYLDDELIFDATCHEPANWNLKCLVISAKKINLLAGHHKIKLMGCVDGGTFYIPHYNTGCIENTISPPISGRLHIIGLN